MLRNYLNSAIRNLKRHKQFAALNILGLATGMACAILILLWVRDERSYDSFNRNAPRLYRLISNVAGTKAAVNPVPIAPVLKLRIPAIKDFVRLEALQSVATVGTQEFDEKDIFYVDPAFLRMFSYPLLKGDEETALSRPDGMVITRATAEKFFGSDDVLGKVVHIDDDVKGHNYVVTGVMENVPHNSHLQFGILLPFSVYERSSGRSRISKRPMTRPTPG